MLNPPCTWPDCYQLSFSIRGSQHSASEASVFSLKARVLHVNISMRKCCSKRKISRWGVSLLLSGTQTQLISTRALLHYIFSNCYVAIKHRLPCIDFWAMQGAIRSCKFWKTCVSTTLSADSSFAAIEESVMAAQRPAMIAASPWWSGRDEGQLQGPLWKCRFSSVMWITGPSGGEWCGWCAPGRGPLPVSLIINSFSATFTHLFSTFCFV